MAAAPERRSIAELGREALRSALGNDARGAVLLADEVATELLGAHGGISLLLELGVSSVRQLDASEPRAERHAIVPLPGAPQPTHAVVLCTQPVEQIGALLDHAIDRAFERCVVLCSPASLPSAAEEPPRRDGWEPRGGARGRQPVLGSSGPGSAASLGRDRAEEGDRGEAGGEGEGEEEEPRAGGWGEADGGEGRGEGEGEEESRAGSWSEEHGGEADGDGSSEEIGGAAREQAGGGVWRALSVQQGRWASLLGMRVQARLLSACTLPLGADSFLLAGHAHVFPLLHELGGAAEASGGGEAEWQGAGGSGGGPHGDGEGERLTAEAADQLDRLARSLHALLPSLGCAAAQTYALGATSRLLAHRMHALPLGLSHHAQEEPARVAAASGGAAGCASAGGRGPPPPPSGSLAIVLVDRSLDLATPMLCSEAPLHSLQQHALAAACRWPPADRDAPPPPELAGCGGAACSPLARWASDPLCAALSERLLLAPSARAGLQAAREALLDAAAAEPRLRAALLRPGDLGAPLSAERLARLIAALRDAAGADGANADGPGSEAEARDEPPAAMRSCALLEMSECLLRWLGPQIGSGARSQQADAQQVRSRGGPAHMPTCSRAHPRAAPRRS